MGQSKLLLPWGKTTILGQVLQNLRQSQVNEIFVVTGKDWEAVAEECDKFQVRTVHNPDFLHGEMLSSIQVGVRALPAGCAAALIMLADQPFITPETINTLLTAYRAACSPLVAPQFEGHRGNPVLFDRQFFPEILTLPAGSAPRELIEKHEDQLCLVSVLDRGILIDIDQPEIYERLRPDTFTP